MLRRSGRVRKILVAVLVALVVIGAVGLAILPEIVRRVAVSQAAKITGRVLSLEDVDLNLFTGRTALHRFRLAQRGSDAPALEIIAAFTSSLGGASSSRSGAAGGWPMSWGARPRSAASPASSWRTWPPRRRTKGRPRRS